MTISGSVIWLLASITLLNYKLIFYFWDETSSACLCDLRRRLMGFYQCWKQVIYLLADSCQRCYLAYIQIILSLRIMCRCSSIWSCRHIWINPQIFVCGKQVGKRHAWQNFKSFMRDNVLFLMSFLKISFLWPQNRSPTS